MDSIIVISMHIESLKYFNKGKIESFISNLKHKVNTIIPFCFFFPIILANDVSK